MNSSNHPKSLVLVVGAGASNEVKLPIGSKLREKIAIALNLQYDEFGRKRSGGDNTIDQALRILAVKADPFRANLEPFLRSSWRIRDAMPQSISIDNFIHSNRSDELIPTCGKLAIARCILEAEAESDLYINSRDLRDRINFKLVEETWFNTFFQIVTENCQESEIPSRLSKIAIVSFNYDRCIAHYFHGALQNYYGISYQQATEAMGHLKIFHPYGSVGLLPWQTLNGGVQYGAQVTGHNLIDISEGIKTFTEGIDPQHSDIIEIREILAKAERIAFLGFAFHQLNLKLLFPGLEKDQKVLRRPSFATGYGISEADGKVITDDLRDLGAIHPESFHFRNDLKCASLFNEYRRSLSIQP